MTRPSDVPLDQLPEAMRQRELHWRELIAAQEASGQSIKAFCEGRSVPTTKYFHWRKELRRRDAARGQHEGEVPAFVPLLVRNADSDPQAVEVVVRGERRIRVPPGFDAALVARLVRLLEGLPC